MRSTLPLAVVACLAALGCGPPSPAPPAMPAGIAALTLPADSQGLASIAAEDDPSGALPRRRAMLTDVSRQLLMAPPSDALVPELFDLLSAVAPRMEAGAISPNWGSYVYTSYQQDLRQQRPNGVPRRSRAEVERVVEQYVEFFRLQAREGRVPSTVEDAGFEATRAWRDERRLGR